MTVGEAVSILQLCISPPLGIIADSMSAAVVPGAKLLPMTTYGPAVPLILISSPGRLGATPLRGDWDTAVSKRRSFLTCRERGFSRGGRTTRGPFG